MHGRFRVERSIPASFNQTSRLLRRTQALEIDEAPTSNAASLPSNTPPSLTGKERLGKKWMDEQRIDNCKVPIDKRGTKPRPGTCPHVPMG